MKKLLAVIIALLIVGLCAVYFFIPSTLEITETTEVHCVPDAAFRTLSNRNSWVKWWPEKSNAQQANLQSLLLQQTAFSLSDALQNNLSVLIKHNEDTVTSHISLLNIPTDSTLIKWQCNLYAGSNPFKRIQSYREAVDLKQKMHSILVAAHDYLSKFDNIYGFAYFESSTNDTSLVTIKSKYPAYPTTAAIYNQINKLESYCNKLQCKIIGPPMLNVSYLDSAYQAMLALPIEHMLPDNSEIKGKKMIPGRFVITDVTGGPYAIAETHRQIIYYLRDYHRMAMAIPFEYLITNRIKETDTSKWQTRIYSPVY